MKKMIVKLSCTEQFQEGMEKRDISLTGHVSDAYFRQIVAESTVVSRLHSPTGVEETELPLMEEVQIYGGKREWRPATLEEVLGVEVVELLLYYNADDDHLHRGIGAWIAEGKLSMSPVFTVGDIPGIKGFHREWEGDYPQDVWKMTDWGSDEWPSQDKMVYRGSYVPHQIRVWWRGLVSEATKSWWHWDQLGWYIAHLGASYTLGRRSRDYDISPFPSFVISESLRPLYGPGSRREEGEW